MAFPVGADVDREAAIPDRGPDLAQLPRHPVARLGRVERAVEAGVEATGLGAAQGPEPRRGASRRH